MTRTRPEARDDQHGTRTGYAYGCRCDACRAACRAYYAANRVRILARRSERNRQNPEQRAAWNRAYYKSHPEVMRAAVQRWREANLDYARDSTRDAMARTQSASRGRATATGGRWEPYEDALLERIPSNIAAASALGRTYSAVATRRKLLRASSQVQS